MFDCSISVIEPRILQDLRTYPEWHYCCFAFRRAIGGVEMAVDAPIAIIDWSQRSLLCSNWESVVLGEEIHVIT